MTMSAGKPTLAGIAADRFRAFCPMDAPELVADEIADLLGIESR